MLKVRISFVPNNFVTALHHCNLLPVDLHLYACMSDAFHKYMSSATRHAAAPPWRSSVDRQGIRTASSLIGTSVHVTDIACTAIRKTHERRNINIAIRK